MRTLRLTAAAAAASLLLAACEGRHNLLAPTNGQPTFDVTTQSGAIVSFLTVCKYGSAASFSQVVNGVPGQDFSLADGACITADSHQNFTQAQVVTVTEHVPAGTRLDSIVGKSTNPLGPQHIFVDGDTSSSITVRIGDDMGNTVKFYNTQLPEGQIGDFVWDDLNGNGIQDAGEPGLAGQTVTLTGPVTASTVTNGSGGYLFTNLPPGNYTVTVATPPGFTPSPSTQGTDTTMDSNGSPAAVTLPTNLSTNLTIDFGFVPAPTCTPVSNPSNFNGTAIANGNTIWFNTIFKPSGVPSGGGVVNFTGSSIAITSGGHTTNVTVPSARITFLPGATSASTTWNPITSTWETVVPANFTQNIFLSGVGYAPAGGLPGGANPVTWTGQFTTTMSGFHMNWQWAAAVYTTFGAPASIGPKPIDGNAMNPYNNSDHAGTPEGFKSFVTGGARGGGGSNWTGSYSGTVAPPVCQY